MADISEFTVSSSKEIVCSDSDNIQPQNYVEQTEDPYNKSISYLERHNILQLFQNLTTDVIYNRPSDPLDYLIKEVQLLQQQREQSTKK